MQCLAQSVPVSSNISLPHESKQCLAFLVGYSAVAHPHGYQELLLTEKGNIFSKEPMSSPVNSKITALGFC